MFCFVFVRRFRFTFPWVRRLVVPYTRVFPRRCPYTCTSSPNSSGSSCFGETRGCFFVLVVFGCKCCFVAVVAGADAESFSSSVRTRGRRDQGGGSGGRRSGWLGRQFLLARCRRTSQDRAYCPEIIMRGNSSIYFGFFWLCAHRSGSIFCRLLFQIQDRPQVRRFDHHTSREDRRRPDDVFLLLSSPLGSRRATNRNEQRENTERRTPDKYIIYHGKVEWTGRLYNTLFLINYYFIYFLYSPVHQTSMRVTVAASTSRYW